MAHKYRRVNNKIWVGRTAIGAESVQVVVDFDDGGGHFQMMPTTGVKIHPEVIDYLPFVVIGLKQDAWRDVMEIMVHEAVEFAFCRMKCRYDNTESEALSTASFVFISNHVQFTEIMAMASEFLDDMFLPISSLFLEEQTKQKKIQAKIDKKLHEAEMLADLRFQKKEQAAETQKKAKERTHETQLRSRIYLAKHPLKRIISAKHPRKNKPPKRPEKHL